MNNKLLNDQSFEHDHLDILQNIEATILRFFQENPGLGDLQVDAALESLIRTYQGETIGHTATLPRSELAKVVYTALRQIGEWRIGRQGFQNEKGASIMVSEPIDLEIWIACLKRIRKSIKIWNKSNGSQGYLNYIAMFIR